MAQLLLSIGKGISIEANVQDMQAGKFVDIDVSAIGATGTVTWLLIGTLPPGLQWTTDIYFIGTGNPIIVGVPTTPGDYTFSIKATDAIGYRATRSFSVTVAAADALNVTDGTVVCGDLGAIDIAATGGETMQATLSVIGGVPPYADFVVQNAFTSLTFDTSTGEISGILVAGNDSIVLQVSDALQTITFSAQVTFAVYTINANQPSDGTRGAYFEHQFSVVNDAGTPPIVWSVVSGSVPPGLSLSGSGLLSGYPAVTGAAGFILQADSAGGATDQETFTFAINAATITVTQDLPDGQIYLPYYGTLTPSGGYGAYTAQVTSGALPTGLTLSMQSGVAQITGTPQDDVQNVGATNFTVTLTDAFGNTQASPCSITLAAVDLVWVDTTIPETAKVGQFYHGDFSISGGLKPYAGFTVVSGSLPPGLTVKADNPGAGRFYFGHIPTTAGTYNFTLRATDNQTVPDTADQAFTITVDP